MFVSIKQVGKKKNSIEEVPFNLNHNVNTVGELLDETVKMCVQQYMSRQERKDLLKILSEKEIENMAAGGKVSFGMNYGEGIPDVNQAVENARQSFLDGIVVVFIDGEEKSKLEDTVELKEDTKVTFVRMTMLSGRMW